MSRISDFLDRKAEEIEEPPVLPIGLYTAQVIKHPETIERKMKDGGTLEIVQFQCRVIDAMEVDEDELAEYGKVSGAPFRVEFLLNPEDEAGNERSVFRIRTFLETLGVFEEGMTLREGFAAAPSGNFGVELGHRPNEDGSRIYIDVKRTFTLD